MKLIITRHGETIENQKEIIQGHMPGKLSEKGMGEAKKVALRLKDEKIDYIYSSDLARAADTAKEIAKFHPKVPIEFVKELRERKLGELEGKCKKDVGLVGDKWSIVNIHSEGIESGEEMFNRAKRFLDKTIKKHHKGTVLFVCHGGIKKALVCAITGKKSEDMPLTQNFKNTSVSIFEIDKKGDHKIYVLNCIKHLD